MSTALRVFSGCSFAQPLGLAPLALCPKSRNATADFYFFPSVSRSQYYSPLRKGYVPFPSCGGCSIAATPPRRSSQKKLRKKLHFFYCGAWGCSLNQKISFKINIFWYVFISNFSDQSTTKNK